MRLFTALDLPLEVLPMLEALLAVLRPQADIKWTSLENLHITTKFIGEWPESDLEALDLALQRLPAPLPFRVELSQLGWFPHFDSPRVFWLGVNGGHSLPGLAAAVDRSLSPLGVAAESRPFSPHLTLARVKHSVFLGHLNAKAAALSGAPIAGFEAAAFHLYLSRSGTYTKLRTYPFNYQRD